MAEGSKSRSGLALSVFGGGGTGFAVQKVAALLPPPYDVIVTSLSPAVGALFVAVWSILEPRAQLWLDLRNWKKERQDQKALMEMIIADAEAQRAASKDAAANEVLDAALTTLRVRQAAILSAVPPERPWLALLEPAGAPALKKKRPA